MQTPVETIPTRILVAVDGSPHSMVACRYAAGLAHRLGATLIALHAVSPDASLPSFGAPTETARAALQAETTARLVGESILDEARAAIDELVPLEIDLAFGEPAEVIINRARELEADLIVVGSRGLGLVDRLLLGSVSTAVVQQAHCPVLVVRDPAEE